MDFLQLTRSRTSVRCYTGEAVSREDMDYIMECARMAPSACNKQPWRFVIIESEQAKNDIRKCYTREWFAAAPTYILCMRNTEESWVRPDDHKQHGDIDLAIAAEHICLAAADRGLGSCWVCNYDVEKMRSLFPMDGYEAVAIIPIGHPAPDTPTAEKKRKAMDDIVIRR